MEKDDELLFAMNTRLTRVEAGQEKVLERLVQIEKDLKEAPVQKRTTLLACISVILALEKLVPFVLRGVGL